VKKWKLIGSIVLIGAVVCALTYAAKEAEKAEEGESERQVTKAQVPAAALATLKKLAGGAKIYEFAEEVEYGHTFYEGSWKTASGANIDTVVTPAGDLVEIEEEVSAAQVPAGAMSAAQKAAGKDAKLAFEKKTMIYYEAKFQKDGQEQELLFTPDGRCVEIVGKEVKEECKKEDEGIVSLGEVPEAVKATIVKHAAGGEVKKIEKETKEGKVIYEADVIIDSNEVELKVAADGKLLGKEVEHEGEED
jgi:uncharacterized membrane protein YkoI